MIIESLQGKKIWASDFVIDVIFEVCVFRYLIFRDLGLSIRDSKQPYYDGFSNGLGVRTFLFQEFS